MGARHPSPQGEHVGVTSETGMGLVEVMVSLSLMLVLMLGLLPIGLITVATTENEGHLAARVTEYSQDKMEQLLSLSFADATTDTRVFPATNAGGSGLTVGGSADPAAPAALYVDYLDADGHLLPAGGGGAPAGWFYMRCWQIGPTTPAVANMKQVTVTTIVARGHAYGRTPRATLVALKSNPF